MHPNNATPARQRKLVIETPDRSLARSLAGALQDLMEPAPDALTLFEEPLPPPAAPRWRIEAYYADMPDAREVEAGLGAILGQPSPPVAVVDVPDENWVAISQAALPPVAAGRFTVHGSHDRHRVPRGPNAILVDAGEAFGTAHHATTHGCLAAIDRLTRRRTFGHVLDLGCGSGVLAIAVARALPRARIMATDLDTQSVLVARANMHANAVASRIRAFAADGLAHPALRRAGSFDLLIANILAGPLISLARTLARAVTPGGSLVLSGILVGQAPAVIAAYRAAGFRLDSHGRANGWSTLVLWRSSAGRRPARRSLDLKCDADQGGRTAGP